MPSGVQFFLWYRYYAWNRDPQTLGRYLGPGIIVLMSYLFLALIYGLNLTKDHSFLHVYDFGSEIVVSNME
jgi:hypothetical protein